MDFPRTIDEITPEWLTKVLRESGAIENANYTRRYHSLHIGLNRPKRHQWSHARGIRGTDPMGIRSLKIWLTRN